MVWKEEREQKSLGKRKEKKKCPADSGGAKAAQKEKGRAIEVVILKAPYFLAFQASVPPDSSRENGANS